ncbi:DUF6247 family protein [Microbispora triticiradicis]|uniref:DUF6247 family protein n=1 Tax=Microbispora triticiradicis TaxID=2200763 RepID=UPI001AD7FA72|nr:DUF6247 family protein [Microbispora triticiradicis]GLW22931.1 hypothetical protein Mame01_29740 [Microbispora amethystogenes]
MTAQPVEHHDPHDPDDILARLPEQYHERFLAEYREAMVAAAHETWRYRQLQEVLKIWHLRAIAYSRPGHERARREAREGINVVPAEDVIPRWADLVASRADSPA